MNSEKYRVFLGIPASKEVRKKIQLLSEELKTISGSFNLIPPENIHFTLFFFGEVSSAELEKIKEQLSSLILVNPFQIKGTGLGVFPNNNFIRVIWVGAESKSEMLSLYQTVSFAFKNKYKDTSDFVLHLTLARVKFVKDKEKLNSFLEKYRQFNFGEVLVEKIILYQSQLKNSGPVYFPLAEYFLPKN